MNCITNTLFSSIDFLHLFIHSKSLLMKVAVHCFALCHKLLFSLWIHIFSSQSTAIKNLPLCTCDMPLVTAYEARVDSWPAPSNSSLSSSFFSYPFPICFSFCMGTKRHTWFGHKRRMNDVIWGRSLDFTVSVTPKGLEREIRHLIMPMW